MRLASSSLTATRGDASLGNAARRASASDKTAPLSAWNGWRAPLVEVPDIDFDAIRAHRLSRFTEQLEDHDVALAVIVNPVSLRYVVDWRHFPLFQARTPSYILLVEPDGRMVLSGGYSEDHPGIAEFRPGHRYNVFESGYELRDAAARLADDVVAVTGRRAKVAVEPIGAAVVQALEERDVTVIDAEPLIEAARSVKSAGEIDCMRHSARVAAAGMDAMREMTLPGVTENELYAVLHHVNIANDGDWIEGRMLSSGPRTNPWYQNASDRVMQPGDWMAFDTDMIGPFGYCADVSRTWMVGDSRPDAVQRDLYQRAHAEVAHNADLLKAGVSFRELSERSFRQAKRFHAHRYTCVLHGLGLSDEYPKIPYPQDWDRAGYDGELEADTVLCVESFVGAEHGGPGVKLEDTYLITDSGAELLTPYPFEDDFLV